MGHLNSERSPEESGDKVVPGMHGGSVSVDLKTFQRELLTGQDGSNPEEKPSNPYQIKLEQARRDLRNKRLRERFEHSEGASDHHDEQDSSSNTIGEEEGTSGERHKPLEKLPEWGMARFKNLYTESLFNLGLNPIYEEGNRSNGSDSRHPVLAGDHEADLSRLSVSGEEISEKGGKDREDQHAIGHIEKTGQVSASEIVRGEDVRSSILQVRLGIFGGEMQILEDRRSSIHISVGELQQKLNTLKVKRENLEDRRTKNGSVLKELNLLERNDSEEYRQERRKLLFEDWKALAGSPLGENDFGVDFHEKVEAIDRELGEYHAEVQKLFEGRGVLKKKKMENEGMGRRWMALERFESEEYRQEQRERLLGTWEQHTGFSLVADNLSADFHEKAEAIDQELGERSRTSTGLSEERRDLVVRRTKNRAMQDELHALEQDQLDLEGQERKQQLIKEWEEYTGSPLGEKELTESLQEDYLVVLRKLKDVGHSLGEVSGEITFLKELRGILGRLQHLEENESKEYRQEQRQKIIKEWEEYTGSSLGEKGLAESLKEDYKSIGEALRGINVREKELFKNIGVSERKKGIVEGLEDLRKNESEEYRQEQWQQLIEDWEKHKGYSLQGKDLRESLHEDFTSINHEWEQCEGERSELNEEQGRLLDELQGVDSRLERIKHEMNTMTEKMNE